MGTPYPWARGKKPSSLFATFYLFSKLDSLDSGGSKRYDCEPIGLKKNIFVNKPGLKMKTFSIIFDYIMRV